MNIPAAGCLYKLNIQLLQQENLFLPLTILSFLIGGKYGNSKRAHRGFSRIKEKDIFFKRLSLILTKRQRSYPESTMNLHHRIYGQNLKG